MLNYFQSQLQNYLQYINWVITSLLEKTLQEKIKLAIVIITNFKGLNLLLSCVLEMDAMAPKQIMKHCTGLISLNPPFNSASPRSSTNYRNSNPGPGTYNLPSRDPQTTGKYHVMRQKQSKLGKDFEWMFSNTRSKSLRSPNNNSFVGPGSYQLSTVNRSFHNDWEKSSRFSTKDKTSAVPGPGAYKSCTFQNQRKKNYFGSIFKSRSPRTAKNLFQNTQHIQKLQTKKQLLYFDEEYEYLQYKNSKKQKPTSSFFASKVPRFLTQLTQCTSQQVGPGSYNISSLQRYPLKTQIPRLIKASNKLKLMQKQKSSNNRMNSNVGPGSYNMAKYQMNRALQFKGVALPRQTRFNFKGKKRVDSEYSPGPGQYMLQKYQYIKQQPISNSRHRKIKQNTKKHMMVTLKAIKKSSQGYEGPGSYNLSQFDIKSKLQKKTEFRQKLKLMEIQIPPFNSKVPRLQ